MTPSANFTAYSQYYDAFYSDKNYSEEAVYVTRLIRKSLPLAQTILELGCGTGNHATFISQLGFTITGVEKSAEMVALAKAKGIKHFEPVIADITAFQLFRKFDVVLSLFHVISYLTSNEALVSCFRCVNSHLKNGGLFIFDVWYTPAIHHQQPEKRIKHQAVGHLEIERLAQPFSHINQNIVEVHYDISVRNTLTENTELIKEKHSLRHFSIPELTLLAEFTGFQLISSMDLVSGDQPGIHTWAICFVLKKTGEPHTC